jgi:zinc transport system ATP-binding protein
MASHDLTMVSRHASTVACLNRGMHCHAPPDQIDHEEISQLFGRHVEFIIHGDVPHRVVRKHEDAGDGAPSATAEEDR